MKIILINCDPVIRDFLSSISPTASSELYVFSESDDLDRILRSSDFDLLIAEVQQFPPLWWPALEETRSAYSPPLVVFIGGDSPDDLRVAQTLGVEHYLIKPVLPAKLEFVLKCVGRELDLSKKADVLEKELQTARERIARLEQQNKDASIEQELTYQELSLAYARLQDLNKKKNNFISLATHELKTPITVIKGYHRILLDERLGQLSTQQREILLESEQNCARLNRIVNSLLDLSRMESGRFELVCLENNFEENLKFVTLQLEETCRRKNLLLEIKVEDGIPRFKYDRDRINQVLANLLENAIKFTPARGTVTLTARPHFWERRSRRGRRGSAQSRRKPSSVTTFSGEPNALLVEITDTGVGISREDQKEIFEEFSQAQFPQMARSGMGLGLAIARHIIEAHKGKIWVESEPQQGSKFLFLLPFDNLAN
jgi:signal transduction histidine kinase